MSSQFTPGSNKCQPRFTQTAGDMDFHVSTRSLKINQVDVTNILGFSQGDDFMTILQMGSPLTTESKVHTGQGKEFWVMVHEVDAALKSIKGITTTPLASIAFMSQLIHAYGIIPQAFAFYMTVLDAISLIDEFSSYDQLQRAFYHFLFCICKATKPQGKLEQLCKNHPDPFEMMIMMTFFKFGDVQEITIAKCWARKIRCLWYRYIKTRKGDIPVTRLGLLGIYARTAKAAFHIDTTEVLSVADKYVIAADGSEDQAYSTDVIERVFSACGWSLVEEHPNNSIREGGKRTSENEESGEESTTDPEDVPNASETIVPGTETSNQESSGESDDEQDMLVEKLLALPTNKLKDVIVQLMDEADKEGRLDEVCKLFPDNQQPSYDEIVQTCLSRRLI